MAKQVRTIRLSDQDIADIERFLKQNPFFDFSSLARTAIRGFIENPSVKVKGIRSDSKERSKLGASV